MNLTLSDISINSYRKFLLVNFESNKKEIDVFEDYNKIKILIIIMAVFIEIFFLNIFLNKCFEKYAKKNKGNIKKI